MHPISIKDPLAITVDIEAGIIELNGLVARIQEHFKVSFSVIFKCLGVSP